MNFYGCYREGGEIEVRQHSDLTIVTIGNVILSFSDDTKSAKYLLEELERVLLPENQHRCSLENEIDRLQEKIDELEGEIEDSKESEWVDKYGW